MFNKFCLLWQKENIQLQEHVIKPEDFIIPNAFVPTSHCFVTKSNSIYVPSHTHAELEPIATTRGRTRRPYLPNFWINENKCSFFRQHLYQGLRELFLTMSWDLHAYSCTPGGVHGSLKFWMQCTRQGWELLPCNFKKPFKVPRPGRINLLEENIVS